MYPLDTPLGEIEIRIDDKKVEYEACEGEKFDMICPDLLGRY